MPGPEPTGTATAAAAARQRRPGGGHGVAGMAERADRLRGHARAGPRPAGGWEVEATLRDCKAPVAP